jgi:ADP-dependent NAD(P)H-hydrate dehydratase / NAD(P)H-hydrate epimerase
VLKNFSHAENILVVCGRGNNGGDGFVATRKLKEAGKQVSVVLLARPADLKGDAAEMQQKVPLKPVSITSESELRSADWNTDLIVDALLGTGTRLPVEGLYATAIEQMNAAGAPIIAVDIPSGADADGHMPSSGPVVRADAIVTFTALKPAHIFQFAGVPTALRQIGTPEAAVVSAEDLNLITPHDYAAVLAPRKADSNKGLYGHVLAVAGSQGKAGAAAMVGMAALRTGAGLVTVATPRSVLASVAGFSPELMTEPMSETDGGSFSILAVDEVRKLAQGKTVLAIGPGVSRDKETAQMIRSLVERASLPVVLDADGLNAFEEHREQVNGRRHPLVVTPHPGEMARLTGLSVAEVQKDRIGVARKYAMEHQAYVVLKGDHTVVAEPDGKVWINNTGNPGMSTGGTGDILTGMVAGMVAQHPNNIAAAVIAAVHLHGLAGDAARDEVGEMALIATDLLGGLPEAIRRAKAALQADIL